uniref:C-type lectin domain-containing protein n=1 Tax=Amphilophus citrinellus TaxID=61819 RepID=A0A3Q0S6U9_AMPCI
EKRMLFISPSWTVKHLFGTGNDTISPEPCESANLSPVIADKFILIKERKNWEEALNYCRTYHHDLVSITNPEKQELVKEKAKNATTSHVWLGLRYSCALDLWFWVNDQVVCYENWFPYPVFKPDITSGSRFPYFHLCCTVLP